LLVLWAVEIVHLAADGLPYIVGKREKKSWRGYALDQFSYFNHCLSDTRPESYQRTIWQREQHCVDYI